jgi:hypothetical protein
MINTEEIASSCRVNLDVLCWNVVLTINIHHVMRRGMCMCEIQLPVHLRC